MVPFRMPYCSLGSLPKWIAAFMTIACLSGASAQEAPIEAQLSQTLAGDQLKIGSSFVLQVMASWQQADCRLASGALLHATVQTVMQTNRHTQGVTFIVEAPCGGDRKPLEPVLTSLLAAPRIQEEVEQFPSFPSLGGGNRPASSASLNPLDVSKPTSFDVGHTTTLKTEQLPKTVTLGQVWHLPHVKLLLPSGGSTASAIATEKSSLHLPAKTIFILQVVRQGNQPVRLVPAVADHSVPKVLRSPDPFIGTCRVGSCTLYPAPLGAPPFGFQRAGDPLDLSPLGMRSESDREVSRLEQRTTVHFLSNGEVLVTFPTHELLRHTKDERPTDNPQQVRAILFNTATRSVDRMEQWIIEDHNVYVWPFGRNLLVHEGRFLKLYGPGLQELASFPLDLPLASLRASPDGEHLLIGELRELHSWEDHQMLVDTLVRGPQEEVRWSLLDRNLKPTRTLGTSSNFVPTPILLDGGMIELRKGEGADWFLVGKAWDSSSEKQLGILRSSCFPVLDNTSPDLLAATTCDPSGKTMRTVLTRENGLPVIDQTSTRQDSPSSVTGSSASATVALMLTRIAGDWDQGRVFRFSMIKTQRIEVFGSEDGALLASIPLSDAEHSSNAFALSPNGSVLALVAGHHLTLYKLHP
ncbi:MAG: hypothetical protein WCD57_00010 [Acidobacteriaceae bacterium]